MGLFNIFNKSKGKQEAKVEECFDTTSELLGEIFDLALRYSIDEILLDTYSMERLDITYINNARVELESALVSLGKSLDEYYNNEYTAVSNTVEENKNFSYSLDALGEIFNNSLDLYSEDRESRDTLNTYYAKANEELNKAKELLSDDKTLKEFTGITPIEKVEVIEEKIEEKSEESTEVNVTEESKEDSTIEAPSERINGDDEVDGDLIVDTEKMKVYFIRISRNEEDEINLNLCIENKLDKEVVVKAKNVSVDGTLTEPTFSCNVLGESRVYDRMTFKNDIQQLVNLQCTFYMTESNSEEVIEECKVFMFKED